MCYVPQRAFNNFITLESTVLAHNRYGLSVRVILKTKDLLEGDVCIL